MCEQKVTVAELSKALREQLEGGVDCATLGVREALVYLASLTFGADLEGAEFVDDESCDRPSA